MGCDIHCYVEFKKPKYDFWDFFGDRINPGRHYNLFGHIAGVRRDTAPVVERRGVPDDMSWSAKDDWGGPDWHSATWLTVEEFELAIKRASGGDGPPVHDSYWALLAAMKCLKDRGNEVRVVIWFDN